jgi:hypothetical protein
MEILAVIREARTGGELPGRRKLPLAVQEGRHGLRVLFVFVTERFDAVQAEERQQVHGIEAVARVHLVLAVEESADQHQRLAEMSKPQLLGVLLDVIVEIAVELLEADAVAIFDVKARKLLIARNGSERQRR